MRIVFVRREQRIFLPRFANLTAKPNAASVELTADLGRIGLRRHVAKHLADTKVADGALGELDRHRGLGQTEGTSDGMWQ